MAAYGIPWSQATAYELDHVIELAAGGSSDVRNLYPEPNHDPERYTRSAFVHNDKDAVEAYTHDAICAGKASVTAVRQAMAANWSTAVAELHLAAIRNR